MKPKIFCIVILLLVSCDNGDNKLNIEKDKKISQKEIVKKGIKEFIKKEQVFSRKNNKVIVRREEKSADKNKVDELIGKFDENINMSLMPEDELKEYVKNAIENWDSLNLGYLINKLRANKNYELAIFVTSNMVEKSKTKLERADNLYFYALTLLDNCYSENDYKIAFQTLENAIVIIKNNGIIDRQSLGIVRKSYHLYSTSKIEYENDITTALNYVKKFEKILDKYHYIKNENDIKDEELKSIYNNIAENILGADANSDWKVSQQDLEQLKKHESTLSDGELFSLYKEIQEKTGMKFETLKATLLDAINKIEKEVMPMLKK